MNQIYFGFLCYRYYQISTQCQENMNQTSSFMLSINIMYKLLTTPKVFPNLLQLLKRTPFSLYLNIEELEEGKEMAMRVHMIWQLYPYIF